MKSEAEITIYYLLKRIDNEYWKINPTARTIEEIITLQNEIEQCYKKLKKIIKYERRKYEQTKNEKQKT